ncbi:MAG TPA: flagellar export chaperone FliS [Phycisphaerae bacterium]|nr:flagellar export chaperone FliS [Phycisphaerae bacterium]
MPDVSKQYLRNAVLTASPEQLQLMLFDGAIRYATRGQEAMAAKDFEGMFNALDRAQRIVLQLSAGLRREVNPQLVDQMSALHDFVYRRLVDANMKRDPKAIDDALRILRHQRETWVLLMDRLKQFVQSENGGAPESRDASNDRVASGQGAAKGPGWASGSSNGERAETGSRFVAEA